MAIRVSVNEEIRMRASKRVWILMRTARAYCRHVLRGIANVAAEERWDPVLTLGGWSGAIPLSERALDGAIGYFAETELAPALIRMRLPAVDISAPPRPSELLVVGT